MTPETIFIALDANLANAGVVDFYALPVVAKLAAVENHIIEICEQLKISAPESLWVIAWCETAITIDIEKTALSPDDKQKYKAIFSGLTQRYPNLVIVAGTVQTYKHTSDINKVEQILKRYELLKDLEFVEDSVLLTFIKDEKERLITARSQNTNFTFVRNSCRIFYGKTIWCHDKAAPVGEVNDNEHLTNPLFQPPKQKTLSPIFTLQHPITKEEINIGIEICNEHWFSYLKNAAVKDDIYLHLVISSSIPLRHSYLVGNYTIQLDSRKKPALILRHKEDPENLPIQFYQSNFFKSKDPLTGPLKPTYPLVKNLLSKLDSALKKMLPGEAQKGLKELRDKISDELYTRVVEKNEEALSFLKSEFDRHKHLFVNRHAVSRLFPKPDLKKLFNELNKLVNDDKKENPFFSDIHRRDDARPL